MLWQAWVNGKQEQLREKYIYKTLFRMKIKIGLICFLLAGIISVKGIASDIPARDNIPPPSPIQDSGTFEAVVLDTFSIPGKDDMSWAEAKEKGYSFHGDYAKIKVEKIIEYYHDKRANYNELSVGDELEAMFHLGMIDWDTQEAKPVTKGDLLLVKMSNHYRIEMNNLYRGWRIFQYAVIKNEKIQGGK